eukprot:g14650.t1
MWNKSNQKRFLVIRWPPRQQKTSKLNYGRASAAVRVRDFRGVNSPSDQTRIFQQDVFARQEPCILRNLTLGACVERWSPEYLAEHVPPSTIVTDYVYNCHHQQMIHLILSFMLMHRSRRRCRPRTRHPCLHSNLNHYHRALLLRPVQCKSASSVPRADLRKVEDADAGAAVGC